MADSEQITYIDLELRAKNVASELADITKKLAVLKVEQKTLKAEEKELTKQQRDLAAAYKSGVISQQEYTDALAANTAALTKNAEEQIANADAIKTLNGEMTRTKKEAKQVEEAMGESLNAMRAELALLLKDYDAMSSAERASDAGQRLKKGIDDLTAAVSEQEQATGRFQRNVGNYQSIWDASAEKMQGFGSVIEKIFGANSPITRGVKTVQGFGRTLGDLGKQAPQDASSINATAQATTNVGDAMETTQRRTIGFTTATRASATASQQAAGAETALAAASTTLAGSLKGAVAGVKSLTAAALKFLATPIGAIIGAIAAAIAIAVAAFNKLKEAFARSDDAGTALDSLKGRFKALGDIIKQVFNFLTKIITPIIEGISAVAGAIMSIIPGLNELAEAEEEQVRLLDKVQEARRQLVVQEAKDSKEQARLAQIYQDTTKSAKEREEALKKQVEISKATAKERLKIAKDELRLELLRIKAEGDTSDAAKDKVAQLQAAVLNAEAAIDRVEADATKKLSSFRKTQQEEAKKAVEDAKKRAEEAKKRQEERAKALEELQRKNAEMRLNQIKDEYQRTALLSKLAYDKEVADLNKRLKEQRELIKKHQQNTNSEQYRNAVAQADAIAEAIRLKTENLSAAILEIAKRREQDIANLTRSNAELRVQLLTEGREKVQALYELQSRDLANAIAQDKQAYAESLADLEKWYKNGTLTAEQYNEAVSAAMVKQAEQAERYMLLTAKLEQDHAKQLATLNANETAKALKAINDHYAETLDNLDAKDIEGHMALLEGKKTELQALYDTLAEMSEEQAIATFGTLDAWKEQLKGIADAYKTTADAIESDNDNIAKNTQSAMKSATAAVQGLISTMASYYSQEVDRIIGDKEELTEAEKAEALKNVEMQYSATMAGIVLSQASGMANTYAAGAKAMAETVGGPAVKIASMIAVITSGIATLLSGIMQAKTATQQYNEQKAKINAMAEGGLVVGAGTATSDSIPAMLSNGESVMTARATAAHYDTLSRWNVEGGGRPFPSVTTTHHYARGGVAIDYMTLAGVMRDAVADVQPVVSVKEITRVAKRVQVKENQL